jgi:hypothetical protein
VLLGISGFFGLSYDLLEPRRIGDRIRDPTEIHRAA